MRRNALVLIIGLVLGMLPQVATAQPAPPSQPAAPPATQGPEDMAPGEEVIEARTRDSKTYATEDPAEFRTRTFTEPVHFSDGRGGWADIGRGLRRLGNGRFTNDSLNEFGLSIASDVRDRQLVRFETKDGLGVGFSFEGARLSSPSLEQRGQGASVLFRNVRTDTDLRLTLTTEGLKEELILRSRNASDTYVFPLTLDGVAASVAEDGSVRYSDAAGTERFRTPAGFMLEASGDPTAAPAASSNGVAYQVVQRADGPALEMRLDRGWLNSSARRYPITVDPTYVARPYFYLDTFYWSGNTSGDYRYAQDLAIGRNSTSYRSYLQFGSGKPTPGDGRHVINSATFGAYSHNVTNCNHPVYVKRVTVDWNGYPEAWAYQMGPTYDNLDGAQTTGCAGVGWTTLNVTALARGWENGSYPNRGIALLASHSYTDSYRLLRSKEYGAGLQPYLDVVWENTAPDQPSSPSPAPGVAVASAPASLSASYRDADGDWGYNHFLLQRQQPDLSWTTVFEADGAVTECCSSSVSLPALGEGRYQWAVYSTDGTTGGPWAYWYAFTVDPSAPPIPSISSSSHPAPDTCHPSRDAAFSWSSSDLSGIAGYSYGGPDRNDRTEAPYAQTAETARTFTGLADGAWYLHVRARNGAGVWGESGHRKVTVDATKPTVPTLLTSSSHLPGQATSEQRISMNWSGATDAGCGLAGYAWSWTNLQLDQPPTSPVTDTLAAQSGPLPDGTWWFHLRTIDRAGNSEVSHYGPMVIDTLAPAVTKEVTDNDLSVGERIAYTITVANRSGAAMTVVLDDVAEPGLAPARSSVTIGSGACAPPTTCSVSGQSLRIENLRLDPGTSATVRYEAVAVGTQRGCAPVRNAVNATANGRTSRASVPITVCDSGLGLERWWSAHEEPLGPQATARINPASGNLVVQHLDSTVVQGQGRLGYVLRRTYNAQATSALTLPGSIGANWMLSLAEADDLTGTGLSAAGLYVPSVGGLAETAASPGAITLIDRDGTRHVFTPKAASLALEAPTQPTTARLDVLRRRALPVGSGQRVCVDVAYDPPEGVHLGLWRYVATGGADCGADSVRSGTLLGFAAERPDRTRYEFDATGRMLGLVDANGNELRHAYDGQGRLNRVYEPFCDPGATFSTASTCRAFRFNYRSDATYPEGAVEVRDPAQRLTTYVLAGTTVKRLVRVINPDGSAWEYTYANADPAALTEVVDHTSIDQPVASRPRTAFRYQAQSGGRPRVDLVNDRRPGTPDTTLSYVSPEEVRVQQGTQPGDQLRTYLGIDSRGRVARVTEGPVGGGTLHDRRNTWDGDGTTCRLPDNRVDNNLCRTEAISSSTTPNEMTRFEYGPEGQLFVERRSVDSAVDLVTTYGYEVQYVGADSTTVVRHEVAGRGSVAVLALPGAASSALFAVVDRIQSLTPRGNTVGLVAPANSTPSAIFEETETDWRRFLTTTEVDNRPEAATNATAPSGGTCPYPANPGEELNTGNVCSTSAPAFGGEGRPTVTRNTYDRYGRKATMTTPKAVDDGRTDSYVYTYFPDGQLDLSGTTSAAGWLRAVTDPTGSFAAFGYDAAGNVVRTWDRNATAGQQIATFPGSAASPPPRYAETRYGPPGFAVPWRYPLVERDPMGNSTSYRVDLHGNRTAVTPPRGNATATTTHDITQAFDEHDNLAARLTPAARRGPGPEDDVAWTFGYDARDNQVRATDPNGRVTATTYDAVDRATTTRRPRGTDPASAPGSCPAVAAGDPAFPAGTFVCTTTTGYDGVDNVVSMRDATGAERTVSYDGAHRATATAAPRGGNAGIATVRTESAYDADGNLRRTCRPRQFTESTAACGPSAIHAEHRSYDVAGRLSSTRTYRGAPAAGQEPDPLVTTMTYDADGNAVGGRNANGFESSATFDLLGRRVTSAAPRREGESYATRYDYDPVGNVTAVRRPAEMVNGSLTERVTAYSFDADNRVVDTVVGADNPRAAQAGPSSGTANVRTRVDYDPDGNIVARWGPRAFATSITAPDARYVARVDYDADGRPVRQFLPRYDSSDPALAAPASDGEASAAGGPANGQDDQCRPGTGPRNLATNQPLYPETVGLCITTQGYDVVGNRTSLRLPTSSGTDPRLVGFTYTHDNLVDAVTTPSPAVDGQTVSSRTAYDGLGRPVRRTDPAGRTWATAYTPDGLATSETAPANAEDDVTHVTAYDYDANGNRTVVIDARNKRWPTTYTADDRVLTTADPLGNTTRYTYDRVGNTTESFSPSAVATTDANNTANLPTRYSYTRDNLVETITVPRTPDGSELRRTTYAYDPGGRKARQSVDIVGTPDAQGIATVLVAGGAQAFEYAPNDRLTVEIGRGNERITTTYDPAGNQVAVTDTTSATTVRSTYYLDDLVRNVDDGVRRGDFAYDGAGQPTARHHTGGPLGGDTTTYVYDDAGLPARQRSSLTGDDTPWTWTQDPVGRTTREDQPNGQVLRLAWHPDDTLDTQVLRRGAPDNAPIVAEWSFRHDSLYRMTNQVRTAGEGAGGTPLAANESYSYTYDDAGRVESFTDGATNRTMGWDPDNNRLRYGEETFTYNADGSIASFRETPNANPKPYTYEPFGGLRSDGCAIHSYDGFDRTSRISGPAPLPPPPSGCRATGTVTYTYDGLDRQRTRAVQGGPSITLHHEALGSTVVAQSGTGVGVTPALAYVLDPATTVRAVNTATTPGTAQVLTDDGNGSVATVASNTAGSAVLCAARFDPYGNPQRPSELDTKQRTCTSGTTDNDVFYRGARRDSMTGNYQLGSRTYDPAKATFTTPDSYRADDPGMDLSVGTDPLTQNRYSYVNGDPVNLMDPDGHRQCIDSDCKATSVNAPNEEPKRLKSQQVKRAAMTGAGYRAKAQHRRLTTLAREDPEQAERLYEDSVMQCFSGIGRDHRQLLGTIIEAQQYAATHLPNGFTLRSSLCSQSADQQEDWISRNWTFAAGAVSQNDPLAAQALWFITAVLASTAAARVPAPGATPARFVDVRGTVIDRTAIRSTVSAQRQGRHVLGDSLYTGGGYFRDATSAQNVLDAFHDGSAQILGVTRNGNVVVRVPSVTGFNNNPAAGYIDQVTNVFFIKGSSSPSVVPTNPTWAP